MFRTKKAAILLLAILLLIVVSIPIGIVLFRPALILSALAKSSAAELGYKISAMRVNHLGSSSTDIAQLILLSVDQELQIKGMHAQYSLMQLLAGRVKSIDIAQLELRSLPGPEAPIEAAPTTLTSLLQAFDALPVDALSLSNIQILTSDADAEITLSLQSSPLRIAGTALLGAATGTVVEFDIQRSAPKELAVTARTLMDGELAVDSSIGLKAEEDATLVTLTSTVHIQPLREQLAQLLPADTIISNETVSLESVFEVSRIFDKPSFANISFSLDSPSSLIHATQESKLGISDMQLQLPITAIGGIEGLDSSFQFELSRVYGTGSWTLQDTHINVETRFEDTSLQCDSPNRCDFQSNWQSNLLTWRYDEYFGEDINASAALRFNYSNEKMRVATDLIEISVPSLQSSPDSGGVNISTNLQMNEVELRVGEIISGGFNFASSEFHLGNNYAELNSPAYSGKIQLEEDTLTGILEFDLNQHLQLGVGLQHFFLRDTGDVVLQLATLNFSDAEPLSSLITLPDFDADIVAGAVEGLANISWSRQFDESWRFGGPIALKLDGLSGYYQDYFFVDMNSDLFAEATTPLGIKVTNPASASLSRVDIGLPLEDISWQYSFNTLSQELLMREFKTALLGGTVNIPSLQYDPNRTRQQVDIVLADLNVESIVDLAEYPGVYADGLVSGYLPFIIEGDSITIEKGLVGALNPGGSIRYAPTDPTPGSNQSIQLVNQALSNYQYQIMNTEVFYDEEGELLLAIQLRGHNPDMNNGQAINLNLNITDNIPSLLKSLQASRVISDELERFAQQR